MLRRLFTVLSVVSLVLCAATCVLWVRSYTRMEMLIWPARTPWGVMDARSHGGWMLIGRLDLDYGFDAPSVEIADQKKWQVAGLWQAPADFSECLIEPSDVGEGEYGLVSTGKGTVLGVSHWLITAAFAGLPFWRTVRHIRKQQRYRSGLCTGCGYDLRATPDRCPECGAVPAGRV